MNYEIGIYKNPETGRSRYGVFCKRSHVWYFADKYGKHAAISLLLRLMST